MHRTIHEHMIDTVGAINTTPPRERVLVTVSALVGFLVMMLIATVFTPTSPAYANDVDTTINSTETNTSDDDSPLGTGNASHNQGDPQDSIQSVNTYKPEATTTVITVATQWVDKTGTPVNNTHVNEIGFELYEKRDTGTERLVGEYTLDKANGWRTSITDLPLNETGRYTYRVEETNPDDPHVTVMEGHGLMTVTVTDNQRDGRLEAVTDNNHVVLVNQLNPKTTLSTMTPTQKEMFISMVAAIIVINSVLMWGIIYVRQ